jgi:hypothetical protein
MPRTNPYIPTDLMQTINTLLCLTLANYLKNLHPQWSSLTPPKQLVLDWSYHGVKLITKHLEAKTLYILRPRVSFHIDKTNNFFIQKIYLFFFNLKL